MTDHPSALKRFQRQHDYFVGIDSDGCAFDTMELKHKECFIPNIIKSYGLQPVSKYAREVAEFVNLYSDIRGVNRFPGLVRAHDLLADRPEVETRGVQFKDLTALRAFCESGKPLGNPSLEAEVKATQNPGLVLALEWSHAVNASISEMVHGMTPFPFVRECLEAFSSFADQMCVSATPVEALTAEWDEHDIAKYVALIAGQEVGSKKETLKAAADRGYDKDKFLMIGDAPGDMKAARANDAMFYPIVPGQEEASWERLYKEGVPKFKEGAYAGAYEDDRVKEFMDVLPSTPPWRTKSS